MAHHPGSPSHDESRDRPTGPAGSIFSAATAAPGLTEEALDPRTHLLRVRGDPYTIRGELRMRATSAIAGGCRALIVDLTAAEDVEGPLAWELSRANERLAWRGGRVVVVAGRHAIAALFDNFGLHRSPDVVTTLDDALAIASPGPGG